MSNCQNTPDISVVLPVYNGIAYLETAVRSVLAQKASSLVFEFLICDDSSTDDSFAYLQKVDDPRVTLYQNAENKGLFPTLNFLIANARAPLIHLWAQDDIMLPQCLEKTVAFHQQFPNVNFSFSRLQSIDGAGNLVGKPETFENHTLSPLGHAVSSLLYGSISGNIANVCLVKKAWEQVGGFDENMIYVGDFKMWCLLSKRTPVGVNGEILVQVRSHQGQLSNNLKASLNKIREIKEVYPCFLATISNRDLKQALEKALHWKIYPSYVNQLLLIFRRQEMKLARKYLVELKGLSPIATLFFRWIVVSVFRKVGLHEIFFQWCFQNEVMRLEKTLKSDMHE